MTADLTNRIIAQAYVLVRAIKALGTIEPTGPFERALARLLLGVIFCHRLTSASAPPGHLPTTRAPYQSRQRVSAHHPFIRCNIR
jgi:hypothetical protein